jgi:hypothetical protein
MAKGQRLKPEQTITLLRQIVALTTKGKTLTQACKEVGAVAKLVSLEQDLWQYEGRPSS